MSGRFQIEHKDGREYGLDSVKAFTEIYEPQGFVISKQQPNFSGEPWVAPEIPDDEPETKPAKKAASADGK